MIKVSQSKFHDKKGQVMIEAMVALGALTLGYLAVLTLLNQSLGTSATVSDRNIATYLAAEGIEIARNLSDANVRIGTSGGGGFGTNFRAGNYEVTPLTVLEITNNDPDNGTYDPGYRIPSGAPPGPGNPGSRAPEPFKIIQTASAAFPPPNAPNGTRFLLYDQNSGYNYTTGVPTRFKRFLAVNYISQTNYIRVRSIVHWTGKGGLADSVVMEDLFFNWR